MNRQQCYQELKSLVGTHGITVLTTKWFVTHPEHKPLLTRSYRVGLTFKETAAELGQTYELQQLQRRKWTDANLKSTAEQIIEAYGCIPPADFLIANGYNGWWHVVYQKHGSVDAIRSFYQGHSALTYIARDGKSWKSYAEVAFANFLYSRGVVYLPGKSYPDEFKHTFGGHAGIYDFHFEGKVEPFIGKMIDVEIWGGTLKGGTERREAYAQTRKNKEAFNANNTCFLGLEYTDCHDDKNLQAKLTAYLGDMPITVTLQPQDTLVPPTKWGLLDHLCIEAREICQKANIDRLPTQKWFNRTAVPKRAVEHWEPARWGSFLGRVRIVGGLSVLRQALGEALYQPITLEEVMADLQSFMDTHGCTPIALYRRLHVRNNLSSAEEATKQNAARLAGNVQRNKTLLLQAGVDLPTR